MTNLTLKLYISGMSPRSQRAIAALREVCEAGPWALHELSVIDVLERPELAEGDKILATPTLVQELSGCARRLIGDLSDPVKVLRCLEPTCELH